MVAFVIVSLLLLLAVALLLWFTRVPNVGELTVVTGGVKSGKTMACTYWVTRRHKRNLKKYRKLLKKANYQGTVPPERPLIYSNMPIKERSTALTSAHVKKSLRFNQRSTVYINEASLVASSLDIKNPDVNRSLLEFFKLISHELHGGGGCWIDTQSWEDCHFSIKRSVSTVLYIQKAFNGLFFRWIKVQELHPNLPMAVQTMDADNDAVGVIEGGSAHWHAIPKTTFKLYDCYAYSGLTDHLPVDNTPVSDDMKVYRSDLISVREEKTK